MELPVGHEKSIKEFWIEHIKAAEAFDGTLKDYCQQHDLKMGSMSSYRTKLGYSVRRRKLLKKKKSDFIPVKVSPNRPILAVSLKLPDPIWLAEFLKAWDKQ